MRVSNHFDVRHVFLTNNKKTRLGNYLFRLNRFLCKFGWIIPPIQYYEYHANFSINEGKIILKKVNYRTPYTRADLIHNFFIARTDMVKSFGGWNPILKGGEHQNFFIRAKLAGLKVGTTRRCGVIHDQWTNNSEEYQRLRDRGHDYQTIALEEFGFKTIDNYSKFFKGKFGK
jgi:hypothetical protein